MKYLIIALLVLGLSVFAQEESDDDNTDTSEEVVVPQKTKKTSKKTNKSNKKSKKDKKNKKDTKKHAKNQKKSQKTAVETPSISSEPIDSGNWIEEELTLKPSDSPGYDPNSEKVTPKEVVVVTKTIEQQPTKTTEPTVPKTIDPDPKTQMKLTEKVPTFWENFASEYLSLKKIAIAALLISFFIFYRIKTSGKSKLR